MEIDAKEIHLWFVHAENIADDELFSEYWTLLSQEERKKFRSFYFEKQRRQFLITRALTRHVLSMYTNNSDPSAIEFETNKYGKPVLVSPIKNKLYFNLSHSENLAVLAISAYPEIGVDVEWVHHRGEMIEIAEQFFSPIEYDNMCMLAPSQQRKRFFNLWTLKEAYIKACGLGLSMPLDTFSFLFPQENRIEICFANMNQNSSNKLWQFWQIVPSDAHKVAVAVRLPSEKPMLNLTMMDIVPLRHFKIVEYTIAAIS